MKIWSINTRGLGSTAKRDDLSSFFTNNDLDICCVQETKMESFSDRDGKTIWNTNGVRWAAEGAIGRSGGILTFWDDKKFAVMSQWGIGGALVVCGRWRSTGDDFCIINIYAPCNFEEKKLLWDRLLIVVGQRNDIFTCIIGDFNSILEDGERVGAGRYASSRDLREFAGFLENGKLVDVRLSGRKFTWYQSGGRCKSRIDRALINEKWAEKWQDTSLRGLRRTVSDHCAIVLSTKNLDWGPKPFRFVNAWLSSPDFKAKVEDSWREGGIVGWGSFVFKEKLKRLRGF